MVGTQCGVTGPIVTSHVVEAWRRDTEPVTVPPQPTVAVIALQ